jgi:trans-aconitate methyltransferase
VGPLGRVEGVDLSERLLALGRSRAHDLPQLSFHHGDVTSWTGGPYDLVQCVLGIFFLPDMTAGGTALVKRLRPGGRCAVTAWRRGANSPVPELLAASLEPEGVRPSIGRPARVNTPDALNDLLLSTGLRDVDIQEIRLSARLEPGTAWDLVVGSAMRGQLSGLDADAVERVRLRFTAGWNTEVVDTSVLVGLGHKPG